MDMNPMLPHQFGRHSMPPPPHPADTTDYDSPMMDLSVSRGHHNQFHNSSSQGEHSSQDYSHRFNHHHNHHNQHNQHQQQQHQQHHQQQHHHHQRQESSGLFDGPNGEGYLKDIDILNRRQNPVGVSSVHSINPND